MTFALPSELAADLLRQGHAVRLRAQGKSMRPALRSGMVVTLSPVADLSELRIGHVVLALCDGRPVLHRIVRTHPALQTKGDAVGHLDPIPSFILGCVPGSGGQRDRLIAHFSLHLMPLQAMFASFHAYRHQRHGGARRA